MSVKLPQHLIEPRLSEMKAGESYYFWYPSLSVTTTGDCYLDPDASVSDTATYSMIRVERREDGYHVVVISKSTRWSHTKCSMSQAIPVASVREEYDPDLDIDARIEDLMRRSEED